MITDKTEKQELQSITVNLRKMRVVQKRGILVCAVSYRYNKIRRNHF
jgi:hypothetical protein